jgi:hypothetical protein
MSRFARRILLAALLALPTATVGAAEGETLAYGERPERIAGVAAFPDRIYFNPSQYGCRMDRDILILSGDVHRELDLLLSGRKEALSPNQVVVFYERRMAEPIAGFRHGAKTQLFLDVLAACDIYIAF